MIDDHSFFCNDLNLSQKIDTSLLVHVALYIPYAGGCFALCFLALFAAHIVVPHGSRDGNDFHLRVLRGKSCII